MKPKTGFKKTTQKCFEKPAKKGCILLVRYAFKLPSTAKLRSTQVLNLRLDACELVSS